MKKLKISIKNIIVFIITIIIILILLSLVLTSCSGCKILPVYKSSIKYTTEEFELKSDENDENYEIKYIKGEEIVLPKPRLDSDYSLEEALSKRRSVRDFLSMEIEIEKISQILWAAQGITEKSSGKRTSPSAGALYPIEIFIVKSDGTYHYMPYEHKLKKISSKDLRQELSAASLFQESVLDAALDIVLTAIYERTTVKYGERGIRYVHMEAGHVCQNILLTAVTLDLGAVPVGAFEDKAVQLLLGLPSNFKPLYIIPIGYPED